MFNIFRIFFKEKVPFWISKKENRHMILQLIGKMNQSMKTI